MEHAPLIVILFIVFVALLFDFLNGVNDAANSIATVVSTRVLPPRFAVLWAAFFNFIAFLFFGVRVANMIGKGIVDTTVVNEQMVFAGLAGAVAWTHVCNTYGLPISVSHSLIGGLLGAALVKAGPGALVMNGITKVVLFIFLSPLIGMCLGFICMIIVFWVFRKTKLKKLDRLFRRLQLVSAAMFSLGHGGNDAQKTMGIIAVLLFSAGYLGDTFHVPLWIVLTCHFVIALGTLIGGWRVIKTMGMKITKLQPVGGFCAETAGALTLFGATWAGIPVSTTHTITGSIMGVGSTRGLASVRWTVARRIVCAWILTIPCAALASAGFYLIIDLIRM
ncbi:MAG: inorganic phosphate transporter [bacterium]